MKEINPDLNSDISQIQTPERKVLVRSLVIAVMGLSATIGVLFAVLVNGNKSSHGDKDRRIAELTQDLREERKLRAVADSNYTDALIRLVRSKHEFNDRELILKTENSRTLKIQDSLLAIFKKR